jgi:RNA polymerase sigma-70 factor (ECF subfamily)
MRDLEERIAERALTVGRRTALGVLGDPEAAADVAQDVAVIALRRRHRIKDPEKLDAWLYRVATRAALRHARGDGRRRRREVDHARGRQEPVEAASELSDLLALLAHLPHQQRAALTLRYVHDLPDAAIAHALGCREGTVRSLLSRGREALRDDLAPTYQARIEHD